MVLPRFCRSSAGFSLPLFPSLAFSAAGAASASAARPPARPPAMARRLAAWAATALVALLACVAAAQASDVLKLTEDNFEATIQAEPALLVEFFAPCTCAAAARTRRGGHAIAAPRASVLMMSALWTA